MSRVHPEWGSSCTTGLLAGMLLAGMLLAGMLLAGMLLVGMLLAGMHAVHACAITCTDNDAHSYLADNAALVRVAFNHSAGVNFVSHYNGPHG